MMIDVFKLFQIQVREWMEKNKVEAELADHFKLVLHNKDRHCGCFYIEDEWDITIYAPTIENLIAQATVSMVQRLIKVEEWELEQCQVLIYDGNIYEIKDSAKDVKKDHNTLVDDITLTDSYKKAYKISQDELAASLLKLRKRFREEERRARKITEKK